MAAVAQKGLDLYIRSNGEWVFAGVGRPKINGKNDRHDAAIISNMAEGEKECLLYLPLYDQLKKLEIGVDEKSVITPMENPFRHKIVVHGSSITHGIAAGRAGMAYSSRLGRDTGLYCINLGFSGQCTMQPEFASYLSRVEADAFVFDCFSNPSAEVINERFDAFVDTIRRTHPTTPLIFLQTIRRETRNFSTRIEKFEREKQAAAEAQVRDRMKTDKNIYFVDPGDLLGSDHIATADGTVREVAQRNSTSGQTVVIDHGNGYETSYNHLSKIDVRKGQQVRRGDIIALSGDTGLSLAPHLHYEVRYNGMRVDPIHYFFMELSPTEYQRLMRIAQSGMQSFD